MTGRLEEGSRSGGQATRDQQAACLAQGVTALSLDTLVGAQQQDALLDYLALLSKWNGVYNLTAIRDPRQMLIQHVLDSLAIVPHLLSLGPSSLLDVGTGGGLPGMVLAIVLPSWQITLNDIVHKKTAFLTHAKGALALPNVTVVTGRVETLTPGGEVPARFDAVVSRAFAEMVDFVTVARHLVAPGKSLWAMKGVRPDAEIARLPADVRVAQIIELNVPMLDAARHLVEIAVETA